MSLVDVEPGATLIVNEGGRRWAARKSDIGSTPGAAIVASRILPASGNVKALLGYALCETTGSQVASLRIHDGLTANTQAFARINLAANESTRDFILPYGVRCTTGELFIEMILGSVEGVIFWR